MGEKQRGIRDGRLRNKTWLVCQQETRNSAGAAKHAGHRTRRALLSWLNLTIPMPCLEPPSQKLRAWMREADKLVSICGGWICLISQSSHGKGLGIY